MHSSSQYADPAGTTAEQRWSHLVEHRSGVLERAYDNAELTIPSLLPREETTSEGSVLYIPYQSVGAAGVNNIAAKLVVVLFPPNANIVRYHIHDLDFDAMARETGNPDAVKQAKGDIEEKLAKIERSIKAELETASMRVFLYSAMKQYIAVGNYLIHYDIYTGRIKGFRVNRYCVKRDAEGNLIEVIVKEGLTPQQAEEVLGNELVTEAGAREPTLHTYCYKEGDKWVEHQEVNGVLVPGSEAIYTDDEMPWIVLRSTEIDGEDYGRSYIEDYMGDLRSLEHFTEVLFDMAAEASRNVVLVRPGGLTDLQDVVDADNGDAIEGREEDVAYLQFPRLGEANFITTMRESLERSLAMKFLLNSAVQRNGERVTAEEIRYMAGELEDALGGIYSMLSKQLQLPLVRLVEARLRHRGVVPKLGENVKPKIVTGMAALGRGQDLQKLTTLKQLVVDAVGPENLPTYINLPEYLERVGASLSIEMDGLVKSEEEIRQAEEQKQLQELTTHLGPHALKGGVDLMNKAKPE